ncbi:MAG: hypothetical protein ACK52W_07805 [Alphaproteobacteria bacterium]
MKITSHTTLVVGKANRSEQIPPGTPVDIEDEEAKDLIARGLAVRIGKEKPARTTAPEAEPQAAPPSATLDSGAQS